jgi:hypothetical protein
MVRDVNPMPNTHFGGPHLVIGPWLIIQCIRSYQPWLETVPPTATRGRAKLWWQGTT